MPHRRLNVLIYPMWSVDSINADSNYIIIKQICNELIPTGRFNFYLIMDSNRKYVRDDLNKMVRLIGLPQPRSKKLQVAAWNTNALRQILDRLPIDIVWNNVVERGHHFKWWQDTLEAYVRPIVFNYHHYVIHRSLNHVAYYNPCQHILADQLSGSLQADCNYFHTQHCRDMLFEEAADWLHPKKIDDLESRTICHLGGYCNPIASQEKYDKFTFVYNHRMAGYKNWRTTWELFDQLHDEDFEFEVILTGGDKGGLTKASRPYTKIRAFTTHADYLQELARCHANVINSQHETYCIAIAESMMCDQVVVAPNAVTFPELLGQAYPYLFDTVEAQLEMLRQILTNDVRQYNHDTDRLLVSNHAKYIGGLWTGLYDKMKGHKKVLEAIRDDSKRTQIAAFMEKHTKFRLEAFVKLIRKLNLETQAFPISKIKMLLDEQGFQHNFATDMFEKRTKK